MFKLAFKDRWLTGFPVLKRKGLCNDYNNNCNTKAGGDALSTLAYCTADTHTYTLTHIPDRHTQTETHRIAYLGSRTPSSK